MHQRAVRMVHVERATGATLLPIRTEHEVIDNELAFAIEEVGECFLATRGIENVVLLDLDPGKLAAFRSQSVTLARQLLLFGEQFLASRKPFLSRHYFRVVNRVCRHVDLSFHLSSAGFLLLGSCDILLRPTLPAPR